MKNERKGGVAFFTSKFYNDPQEVIANGSYSMHAISEEGVCVSQHGPHPDELRIRLGLGGFFGLSVGIARIQRPCFTAGVRKEGLGFYSAANEASQYPTSVSVLL